MISPGGCTNNQLNFDIWRKNINCTNNQLSFVIWKEKEILIPAHTDPLYKKLNILKLSQIYIYSVQQFVFKYHHGLLPNIFNEFYSTNSSFHLHNTRSRNMFRLPKSTSSIRIRAMGVRTYNYSSTKSNIDCSFLSYSIKH